MFDHPISGQIKNGNSGVAENRPSRREKITITRYLLLPYDDTQFLQSIKVHAAHGL